MALIHIVGCLVLTNSYVQAAGNYIEVTSTICNGPNVADYATGITSATGCKAECDKHAGCVNALYAPLTGNCFLRGQCEDMHTDNKYDLYQLDNAVLTQCYYQGVPGYVGQAYVGTINTTNSGITCQRWDSTDTHYHTFNANYFTEDSLSEIENYCRNPDDEPGPWCYTTDPDVRWQTCDVPICKPYTLGYEQLPNTNCLHSDIATYYNNEKSLEPCEQACDAMVNCVAFHYGENTCSLTSSCTTEANTNYITYIKMDFPGWSAYAYKNCPGHDIHNEITDTLYECIDRCISHPDCVAVLFLPPGQCYLKSACEQLISVASNIDLFAYRMLDREVSGYSKVTMASIQAYDEQQGSSVGYSFGVREIWQCAAWCRRYGVSCQCFEVKQDLSTSDLDCFIKPACDSNNFIVGDSNIYIPSDFSTAFFIHTGNTWCRGSDVDTEFPSIPSASECVNVCRHKEDCRVSVYDFYRKVCYVKSSCQSTETSLHHDMYEKVKGEWGEWSQDLACGDPVAGQVSRQRQCNNGAYCDGDAILCRYQCRTNFDVTHGFRLPTHIIHSEQVASLIKCLAICQQNCDCYYVNYRIRWVMGNHPCELVKKPEGLDISPLLSFAPDYVFIVMKL